MEKLTEILKDLEQGKISADHAESQILRLFNVVKKSEQLCFVCKKEIATHGIGKTKTVCGKCWNVIIV